MRKVQYIELLIIRLILKLKYKWLKEIQWSGIFYILYYKGLKLILNNLTVNWYSVAVKKKYVTSTAGMYKWFYSSNKIIMFTEHKKENHF